MQKIMIIVGAVIALTLSALGAGAATLTNIRGDVKVNTGSGFKAVTKSVTVQIGDRVLVGQDAFASIAYKNGAVLPLKSGQLATVKSNFAKPMTVGEQGAAAAAATTTGTGLGIGTTALVVGGVVVAGVAVAVVASQKNDAPASP